jgi:hypothetical protein
MLVNPIHILPYPFPSPAIPGPANGNPGVVPKWLQRDLGYEATNPTEPGHDAWWLDDRDQWQPGWRWSDN